MLDKTNAMQKATRKKMGMGVLCIISNIKLIIKHLAIFKSADGTVKSAEQNYRLTV